VTRRRPLFLALACVALIALALGLAACGDDDDDSGAAPATTAADTSTAPATPVPTETTPSDTTAAGGGTTVDVAADPSGQLKFTPTELSAPAGEITLDLTNDSAVPHNIAVDGADGVSDTIQDGGTADLTVNLPAGTYEYYCDVPGHRQAGMVGTLTVN
jgi:plastocyanin